MPTPFLAAALLALATVHAGLTPAAASAPDPLSRHRWTDRVLVVSALRPDDPLLASQRQAFRAMRAGARERDLVLVEAVGDGPDARGIRERLGLDPSAFQAVLVGKDGGAKLRSAGVLGPDALFPLIDAMPMRREEMGQ